VMYGKNLLHHLVSDSSELLLIQGTNVGVDVDRQWRSPEKADKKMGDKKILSIFLSLIFLSALGRSNHRARPGSD
jgi:hypothetical protein